MLLENKINKKNDILIFVQSKKSDIQKGLKKRINYNPKLIKSFKKIQLPIAYKKRKSNYVIKNNITKNFIKKDIKYILNKIL